jgi:hypothetical protein
MLFSAPSFLGKQYPYFSFIDLARRFGGSASGGPLI